MTSQVDEKIANVNSFQLRIRLSLLSLAIVFLLTVPALPALAAESKAAEAAGAILFRDKGCTYCHGVSCQGTNRGPSLAHVRKEMKPPQIVQQITNGGQKMPPFRESLSQDEISQLVSFLRAKHRPVAPPAPVSAPLSNPAQ